MSDTPGIDPDTPIDAEFEPAAPKPRRSLTGTPPGWPAFFGLAGLTALSLLISLLSTGLVPGFGSNTGLKGIEKAQSELTDAQELSLIHI